MPAVARVAVNLQDPAAQLVTAGITVLDVDPPALTRRGAAPARGRELEHGLGLDVVLRALDLPDAGLAAPGAAAQRLDTNLREVRSR